MSAKGKANAFQPKMRHRSTPVWVMARLASLKDKPVSDSERKAFVVTFARADPAVPESFEGGTFGREVAVSKEDKGKDKSGWVSYETFVKDQGQLVADARIAGKTVDFEENRDLPANHAVPFPYSHVFWMRKSQQINPSRSSSSWSERVECDASEDTTALMQALHENAATAQRQKPQQQQQR